MRALSFQQAQSCEEAREPKCRCRCNGALHGAARGLVTNLPHTDPHSPTTTCKRCSGTGTRFSMWANRGEGGQVPCGACKGSGRELVGSVPTEAKQ